MTLNQQMITILLVAAAGMLTRYLPFLLFPEGKQIPPFVNYLGKVLPSAVFGFLVIYCLRNVTPLSGSHGIPELTAGLITAGTYVWKRNTLLSIAAGTIAYMLLVQLVF